MRLHNHTRKKYGRNYSKYDTVGIKLLRAYMVPCMDFFHFELWKSYLATSHFSCHRWCRLLTLSNTMKVDLYIVHGQLIKVTNKIKSTSKFKIKTPKQNPSSTEITIPPERTKKTVTSLAITNVMKRTKGRRYRLATKITI